MKRTEQDNERGGTPPGPHRHRLEENLEQYIREKSAVAEEAWARLYALTIADLRVRVQDKELTAADARQLVNTSEDPQLRRAAYAEWGRVLGENKKVFALVINTLADLKAADDARRGFENPEDSRCLSDQAAPEAVNALAGAMREFCPSLSHRYYAWKAKKLGVEWLHPADIHAPLPGGLDIPAAKIESMLDAAIRATALFTFEQRLHQERRETGELSPGRIAELWLETQKECFGPAVDFDAEGAENFWMAEAHFFQAPFSVYTREDTRAALGEHIDALEALDRKIEAVRKTQKDFQDTAGDIIHPFPPPPPAASSGKFDPGGLRP